MKKRSCRETLNGLSTRYQLLTFKLPKERVALIELLPLCCYPAGQTLPSSDANYRFLRMNFDPLQLLLQQLSFGLLSLFVVVSWALGVLHYQNAHSSPCNYTQRLMRLIGSRLKLVWLIYHWLVLLRVAPLNARVRGNQLNFFSMEKWSLKLLWLI